MIHTLSKKNYISIDIYSCKAYNQEKAVEFTRKYFEPRRIEKQFILRGKHYFDAYKKAKQ